MGQFQPTIRLPFEYVTGIPQTTAVQIRRDFEEVINNLPVATKIYDAIVDSSLAANNTTTNEYTTVFAALQQLATNGLTTCSIGVRPRSANITETGSLSSSPNTVRIEVIGGNTWATASGGAALTIWNLGGFNDGGHVGNWVLNGLEIQSTLNASQKFFTGAGVNIYATNCFFSGNNTRIGAGATSSLMYASGCLFQDITFACFMYCNDTCFAYSVATGPQWQGDILCTDCELAFLATGITLTVTNVDYTIWTGHMTLNSEWAGSLGTATSLGTVSLASFGTTACVYWDNRPPSVSGNNNQRISINVQGAVAYLTILGTYQGITTVAQPTSPVAPVSQRVQGQCFTADITGPAVLDLTVGNLSPQAGSTCILRGSGFSGSIVGLNGDGAAGTVFQAIGMKRSTITLSLNQQPGSVGGTMKQYSIDAASANNVIIMEADAFGLAGTNSSATTLIINDSFAGGLVAVDSISKDWNHVFLLGGM